MRIIAGAAKGRRLDSPKSGTRPMTGRARESVFSILSSRIVGARVLDLYAGSGSLGLEAVSRGASGVVFVEKGRVAATILRSNVERVGLGGTVRERPVVPYLRSTEEQFDVIFVDPPYADTDRDVSLVLELAGHHLTDGGVVVVHRQARSMTEAPDFLRTVDTRQYGDAVVTMMERAEG